MNFDYTLYLVTDRQLMSCDSLTEAVEQAILGGCTMIQLREKELSSLEFYNQAVAVKQVTDKYHIPLIINDRIDIAMAVQATGVHIGQHDLPAAAVRKVIGENMLLGVFSFCYAGNIGFGDWTGLPIRTGRCENDESILLLFISVADRIDIFSNPADCAIHLDFLHNWKSEKAISC